MREPRMNVTRAGPVSQENEVDPVGGDPLPGHPGEIVNTDHAVHDDTRTTADGNPTLLSARIDGQHRHRNATWTGPTV